MRSTPTPSPAPRLLAPLAMLFALLACDDTIRATRLEDTAATEPSDVDVAAVVDSPVPTDLVWDLGPAPSEPPPFIAPIPPLCRGQADVGEVRFVLEDVAGHLAIDGTGTIFAPLAAADGARDLAAFDPCGELLWRSPGIPAQSSSPVLRPHARRSGDKSWLTHSDGFGRAYGLWCYELDGTPCDGFDLGDDLLSVFVGIPDGAGPYVVVLDARAGRHALRAYDARGDYRVVRDGFLPSGAPCAIRGALVACTDGVYSLRDGAALWSRPAEIIDGTARHALTPAIDGGRVISLVYGISTYDVIATALTTGEPLFRVHLGPSNAGQTGLLAGQPVIGYDGEVFVYLNVQREGHDGALVALDRGGRTLWTFPLDAGERAFTGEATHVVGRDGVVYLAVNSVLAAIDRDGDLLWQAAVVGTFSDSGPVLSDNGDVAVRTDEGFLYVFATTSAGPALSPWPAAGGDSRNGNAR